MTIERRWWLSLAAVGAPLGVFLTVFALGPFDIVPGAVLAAALHGAAWIGVLGTLALPLPGELRLAVLVVYALLARGLVFLGDLEIAMACYGIAL